MPHLAASVIARSVLVSVTLAPATLAQVDNRGGDIDVSTNTLTIKEGESSSRRLRLSKETPADGRFVRVFVDGTAGIDGNYVINDEDGEAIPVISWVPSVRREYRQGNYDQWRNISIAAPQDDEDASGRGQLWDEDTSVLALHGVPAACLDVRIAYGVAAHALRIHGAVHF